MSGIAIVDVETIGLNAAIHGIWEAAVILHDPPDDQGRAPVDDEIVWQLPVDLSLADPDALRISTYYTRRWRTPPPMNQGFDGADWFGEAVAGYPDDRFRPNLDAPPRDDERFVVPIERMRDWAARFASVTADRILVGAVPSFDEKRLSRLLRECGAAPAWHYRPICVETLAVGYLAGLGAAFDAVKSDAVRRHGANDYSATERATKILGKRPDRPPLPWSSTAVSAALGVGRARAAHTAVGDCRWVRDLWVKIMEET